jgi:predicted enzyme related to lactoylglutathione lyase
MSALPPNAVAHFDVSGPDLGPLGSFYAGVFGWEVDVKGPGYALVGTPDGSAGGALVEAEEPSLVLGVVVPDLDAAVAAAVAGGGEVLMAPVDNGWVVKARVADPAGNPLTLIQG